MYTFMAVLLLLLLLLTGMPIGFALMAIGSLGILIVSDFQTFSGILSSVAYSSVNNFSFTTIPLFILMAHFISKSNIAKDLYTSVAKWIGHLPGGVGISTVVASAGFGALSGSSIAATSIMSKITVPEMMKVGYKDSFSTGLVASTTGTLAVLIPPSIPLILYAIQTETSIAKLLIAGIFPGILLVILLSLYIIFISIKTGNKSEKASWSDKLSSLRTIWPMVVLIIFIVMIIYLGVATSTEAAAFGAFGALLIGLLLKRLNIKAVIDSLKEATEQTAMIFTIVVGGHLFAYFMTITGDGANIINTISQSGLSKWTILFLIIIFYLFLGLFMDLIGSLILTMPLIFPIITNLGFDAVWFGVIVVLLLEIGLVTPPVGINLFITNKYTGVPIERIFYGSIPFIGIMLFAILLMIIFPEIVLYLPSKM